MFSHMLARCSYWVLHNLQGAFSFAWGETWSLPAVLMEQSPTLCCFVFCLKVVPLKAHVQILPTFAGQKGRTLPYLTMVYNVHMIPPPLFYIFTSLWDPILCPTWSYWPHPMAERICLALSHLVKVGRIFHQKLSILFHFSPWFSI